MNTYTELSVFGKKYNCRCRKETCPQQDESKADS